MLQPAPRGRGTWRARGLRSVCSGGSRRLRGQGVLDRPSRLLDHCRALLAHSGPRARGAGGRPLRREATRTSIRRGSGVPKVLRCPPEFMAGFASAIVESMTRPTAFESHRIHTAPLLPASPRSIGHTLGTTACARCLPREDRQRAHAEVQIRLLAIQAINDANASPRPYPRPRAALKSAARVRRGREAREGTRDMRLLSSG